ncbi:MAG: sulfate adenylyltransferase [Promethearchaeota archaeon]
MSKLPKPHGGKLVNRVLANDKKEAALKEAQELPKLNVNLESILDADKIAVGAFSPLEGFMTREDYTNVLKEGLLANGLLWTIPIALAPNGKRNLEILKTIKEGEDIALFYNDTPIAIQHIQEKFDYSKKELAKQIFGTTETEHPNVNDLSKYGETLIGGKINLIQHVDFPAPKYELTPAKTRKIFKDRGWRSIVAYQTRNPPHMVHEYIQRCALEMVDGLFIHPVVGKLKKGDFSADAIMEAYDFLVKNYYSKDCTVLATLSLSMRYAGPKAAIFLAIIRKNYGCTHFVIGRDMAGVRNYYGTYAAQEVFEGLDLGIKPILFRESFFCKHCRLVASDKTCGHDVADRFRISMTALREMLKKGEEPPVEMMRPEIAKILRKYIDSLG